MIALAAVSCAPAGHSGGATAGATSASRPAASASSAGSGGPPNLNAELLTAADMPAGWSVDSTTASAAGGRGCFDVAGALKPDRQAHASFTGGASGMPLFAESIGWFQHDAHAAFAAADRVLTMCHTLSFSADGETFHGTVAPLPFPSLGDESAAFQVSVWATGQAGAPALGLELVLVRRGATVLSTQLVDAGAPDAVTLSQLTARALVKLR